MNKQKKSSASVMTEPSWRLKNRLLIEFFGGGWLSVHG
jgi:hypothetical protein